MVFKQTPTGSPRQFRPGYESCVTIRIGDNPYSLAAYEYAHRDGHLAMMDGMRLDSIQDTSLFLCGKDILAPIEDVPCYQIVDLQSACRSGIMFRGRHRAIPGRFQWTAKDWTYSLRRPFRSARRKISCPSRCLRIGTPGRYHQTDPGPILSSNRSLATFLVPTGPESCFL
jgi:hypothetical protein